MNKQSSAIIEVLGGKKARSTERAFLPPGLTAQPLPLSAWSISPIRRILKNQVKKFDKPIGLLYICNRSVYYQIYPSVRRDIFQAIADPTRRGIIALIALQAMTPSAIADHFDMTRQAISKHMRILTECEVVSLRQEGREVYYQLDIDKMKEIDHWLEQYRRIWESRFQDLDQILKTMQKN